VFFIKII